MYELEVRNGTSRRRECAVLYVRVPGTLRWEKSGRDGAVRCAGNGGTLQRVESRKFDDQEGGNLKASRERSSNMTSIFSIAL